MKKDIYIIKNRINEKVYIGQTGNPGQRWKQYKSAVLKKPEQQVITKAMACYGFDNFWMEILEKDAENYDEREKYWIKYYNSIVPNGYNIAEGGKGIGKGITAPGAKIKSQKELDNIIDDLIQDVLSIKEISKKYNISIAIVNEINVGHTYYNSDFKYPLRKSHKFSEEKIKQITYSLKYELDKTLQDISTEYECDLSFLNDINQGRAYFREYLVYPIRKGKMKKQEEYLPLLLDDLKNTSIPQKELAIKYNISVQTVSNVNVGKTGYQTNIEYPIRKSGGQNRTCFSPSEISMIIEDLKNPNLSISNIAKKYGVSSPVISNINKGSIKKYHNDKIKYPIR